MAKGMIMIGLASGSPEVLLLAPGTDLATQLLNTQLIFTDSAGKRSYRILVLCRPWYRHLCGSAIHVVSNATLKIQIGTGGIVSQTMVIEGVLPSLFTANASGSGVPAGLWIRIASNGARSQNYLFDPVEPVGIRFLSQWISALPGTRSFFLLYGTGFRNARSGDGYRRGA